MKKRFYEGEEVVCVDRNMFPNSFTGLYAPDLQYKSKQTIGVYNGFIDGKWWVTVIGGIEGSVYSEDSFCKIDEAAEVFARHASMDMQLDHLLNVLHNQVVWG